MINLQIKLTESGMGLSENPNAELAIISINKMAFMSASALNVLKKEEYI